jgi:phage-related protein
MQYHYDHIGEILPEEFSIDQKFTSNAICINNPFPKGGSSNKKGSGLKNKRTFGQAQKSSGKKF